MALAHAPNLLLEAQAGSRKLTTAERRLTVQYCGATQPELTNEQLATWFQVSERTIRMDRMWMRSQKAKFLKDELSKDLALVIADIAMDFEKQVNDIEKSKCKARLGSRSYLDHCMSVFDMRLKMVKAFQDIGYLPKNLGNMTVDKFEYKAVVLKDGSSVTRPADMHFEGEQGSLDADYEDLSPVQRAQLPQAVIEKDVVNGENGETGSTIP